MTSESGTQVYLASASPRRYRLLASVGLRVQVMIPHIDETSGADEAPEELVVRLATQKALQVTEALASSGRADHPVVGADTCVVVDGDILGKPEDRQRAAFMLRRLSGRRHEVLTAVAVAHEGITLHALSRSYVTVKALSEHEIASYCRTTEPLDKAGAYAIQGLASGFVEYLEGSYTGVVGLPMFELRTLLNQVGIDWL